MGPETPPPFSMEARGVIPRSLRFARKLQRRIAEQQVVSADQADNAE